MATTYVRRFDLEASLTDSEVAAFWKYMMEEFLPACRKVSGVQALRVFSGAGALRADLRLVLEMENAGIYENLLREPSLHAAVARLYAAIYLRTSNQTFTREVTPELIKALSP